MADVIIIHAVSWMGSRVVAMNTVSGAHGCLSLRVVISELKAITKYSTSDIVETLANLFDLSLCTEWRCCGLLSPFSMVAMRLSMPVSSIPSFCFLTYAWQLPSSLQMLLHKALRCCSGSCYDT